MRIDDNKDAYQTMKNSIGSMENRMREIYNKGYKDGIKEGINQAMQKIADSILEEVKADRKTESNSEKPNNCEHITEDGVTCAKYPACDDCLDNPLNKVKGSERLVKGKDEPLKTTDYCDICKRDMCEVCIADATNPYCVPSHYEINYEPKDEPQTEYERGYRQGKEDEINKHHVGR